MIKSKMSHLNVFLITSRKNALPKFQVMWIGELVSQLKPFHASTKRATAFHRSTQILCRAPPDGNACVLNCNKDTYLDATKPCFKDKISSDILYYRWYNAPSTFWVNFVSHRLYFSVGTHAGHVRSEQNSWMFRAWQITACPWGTVQTDRFSQPWLFLFLMFYFMGKFSSSETCKPPAIDPCPKLELAPKGS